MMMRTTTTTTANCWDWERDDDDADDDAVASSSSSSSVAVAVVPSLPCSRHYRERRHVDDSCDDAKEEATEAEAKEADAGSSSSVATTTTPRGPLRVARFLVVVSCLLVTTLALAQSSASFFDFDFDDAHPLRRRLSSRRDDAIPAAAALVRGDHHHHRPASIASSSPAAKRRASRYHRSLFYSAYISLHGHGNGQDGGAKEEEEEVEDSHHYYYYSRTLADDGETNTGGGGADEADNEGTGAAADESESSEQQHQQQEEEEEMHSELSIEASFEDTYSILVFLGMVFFLGEVASFCGIPSLVGQIVAGFLLGPPLADFVPFPEAMVLLGDLGLILLLVEAGIELDVGLVREAGIRPVLIAVAGSVLAFGVGTGVALGRSGGNSIKSAVASGACFAPTSLGVAANALSGGKALNTPVGQLIVASAVIDDVIGLVILSMLEVLVLDDPPIWKYFIPIISAVSYLVVLGGAAVTIVPHVLESKILPRFRREHRGYVALAALYLLVMAYLPLMYYSKASHLTGAFLAGLSFSQVEGVHHAFVGEAGPIMEWLLRIFFSASIGFQVPIKMFGNSEVIAWGFAFYIAVLAKLPVGLFAPKYSEQLPSDYPFNPYARDVTITSVAMTCRGEFSFIIAAFGIGEALLDEELYSAIIFAVLLSSITSPIILTLVLRRYNRLAAKYLEREQLDKSTTGGRAPLHVNIQIRSNVVPGMQASIKNCANSLGLFVIDQRSWHPRGLDVVVATELYAVDGKTDVDVNRSLMRVESARLPASLAHEEKGGGDDDDDGMRVTFEDADPVTIPENEPAPPVRDFIAERCEEIRLALLAHPDLRYANVKVLQWVPLADALAKHSESARDAAIVGEVAAALKNKETIDTHVDEKPKPRRTKVLSGPVTFGYAKKDTEREFQAEEEGVAVEPSMPLGEATDVGQPSTQQDAGLRRRPRRVRTVSSPAVGGLDLWREDSKVQDAAIAGAPSPPVQYDLQSGISYGVARRQRMASDLGAIAENAPLIEERLGGLVRHSINEAPSGPAFSSFMRSSFTD